MKQPESITDVITELVRRADQQERRAHDAEWLVDQMRERERATRDNQGITIEEAKKQADTLAFFYTMRLTIAARINAATFKDEKPEVAAALREILELWP